MLYVLPYKTNADGLNDISKLYEIIEKLKNESLLHNSDQIKIAFIDNVDPIYLTKSAECVFRGTEKKIGVITNKTNISHRNRLNSSYANYTEKVIIKSEGKQYADILREIKKTVNIDDVGVNVKSIKKTTNGNVMVEVLGGKDKAEALKQEIQSKSKDTIVTVKNNDDIIHVLGIDGEINKEEIADAVSKGIGNAKESEIKILSVRINADGRQNATVALRKGLSKLL